MESGESNIKASNSEMTPGLRKKSNVIVRGTSLIFDEIKVAREEENQIKSLDEIEEENGDESSR